MPNCARPLAELQQVLHGEHASIRSGPARSTRLVPDLLAEDALDCEASDYTDLFDRGRSLAAAVRACAWRFTRPRPRRWSTWVKPTPTRGSFGPGELPDYLPAVLEFVSSPATATGARLSR